MLCHLITRHNIYIYFITSTVFSTLREVNLLFSNVTKQCWQCRPVHVIFYIIRSLSENLCTKLNMWHFFFSKTLNFLQNLQTNPLTTQVLVGLTQGTRSTPVQGYPVGFVLLSCMKYFI